LAFAGLLAAFGSLLVAAASLAVAIFAIIHADRQNAPRIQIDVRPGRNTTRYTTLGDLRVCQLVGQFLVTVSNVGGKDLTIRDLKYRSGSGLRFVSLIDSRRVRSRLGNESLPFALAQGDQVTFTVPVVLASASGPFSSRIRAEAGGDTSAISAKTNLGATATAYVQRGRFGASCRPTEK
jgi:hypothetical protein